MAIILDNPDFAAGQTILDVPAYVAAAAFEGVATTDTLPVLHRCAGHAVDAGGFMDGDSDADGDALSYSIFADVSNGTLVTYQGGSFVYTPDTDFVGTDSFSYMLHAGCESNGPYSVTISVDGDFTGIAITDIIPISAQNAAVAMGFGGMTSTDNIPVIGGNTNVLTTSIGGAIYGSLGLLGVGH